MTEKRQKLVNKCFKIFDILDKLDEIGDSDNDINELLKKYKKSGKIGQCTGAEAIISDISQKPIKQTGLRSSSTCSPTKGLKDGQNPLEVLSEEQFVKNYRFSKECVEDILQMISYGLNKFTNRGKPFSPMVHLLITLQFLATGTHRNLLMILYQFHYLRLSC